MKFVVIVFLFFVSFSAFGQLTSGDRNQKKKVAILEVVDKEGTISYGVKLMLRSNLSAAVTNTSGYEGYDRVDIASIMGEQNFQRTGMVSDAQIKKLGEMTGASYILVAEAAALDANHLFITAKILEVESARLERTANVQSGTTVEEFEKACRQLALLLFNRASGSMLSMPVGGMETSGEDFIETVFGVNMKMVYVEGGDFMMGGTSEQGAEAENDEKTLRRVTLDSYYIGAFEVTQGQWERVMGTSVSQQMGKAGGTALKGTGSDYPMYYVSWEEAQAFCQELSRKTGKTYCLPTEAQWEYAARGGNKNEGTKYSGSWSIDAVAWYDGNSGSSTHPVGTKRPNALGIYDMSGNVWEWCSDWYGDYRTYDTQNPTGASSGSRRVLRGGGWNSNAWYCRVSYRGSNSPGSRSSYNGFRVVLLP